MVAEATLTPHVKFTDTSYALPKTTIHNFNSNNEQVFYGNNV